VTRRTIATASAVLLLGLSGCANAQDDEVTSTAEAFYRALADDDGATACAALAPETKSELEKSAEQPCEDAILDEDIPSVVDPRDVQTFGTMAKVDFGAETAFLARFQDGWKVMAAACKDLPTSPYDCAVQGG
jgi:hypothetical protein